MPAGRKPGTPKTGGRKAGTLNRKTQEISELLESRGHNPIEAMVQIETDPTAQLPGIKGYDNSLSPLKWLTPTYRFVVSLARVIRGETTRM